MTGVAGSRSRRAFLVGCGAAAAAAVAWGLWHGRAAPQAAADGPLGGDVGYVDYAGWLVTIADKEKLLSVASLSIRPGTSLSGRALGESTVENLEECATWCVRHPDCVGFSFGSPTHPDPVMRSHCTVLSAREGEPVLDSRFTSGVR